MLEHLTVLALAFAAQTRPATVEIRSGTAPVCAALRQEVTQDWPTLRGTARSPPLSRIEWHQSEDAQSLPPELAGVEESQFDFDNDGTRDRVFMQSFEDHYMQGSVLVMQRGPAFDDPWFMPCQLDARPIPFDKCPLFSQAFDEAGFSMAGRTNADTVFFRARYLDLTPFTFGGTTYVVVEGRSEDTRSYVGVIKPVVGKKFESTCLLHVTRKR